MLRGIVVPLIACLPLAVHAQAPAPPEHPAHAEIRKLRDEMLQSVNRGDVEGVLPHLHPEAILTFMDGRQCRGREELRAYFARMLGGEKPVVKAFSTDVDVARLTTLYGDDFGVAYGTSRSHFDLTNGKRFTADGVWTATLVRDDGRWQIAAFHTSAGMFDNPVLDMAKTWITRAALIAGIAGLALGALAVWMVKRRRA